MLLIILLLIPLIGIFTIYTFFFNKLKSYFINIIKPYTFISLPLQSSLCIPNIHLKYFFL